MEDAGVSPPPTLAGDDDAWSGLQSAQSQLEQTTHDLSSTTSKLTETEQRLEEINRHLSDKENECKNLQAEYWQATAQLSDAIGLFPFKFLNTCMISSITAFCFAQ